MMRTSFLAVALSALSFSAAEMANFTLSNPGAISAPTRAGWCRAEMNTCGTLCVDPPTLNDCEPTDLSYHCTCQNGSAPGLEYYTQTMYSFICQQAFTDCNLANVGNKTGQDACKTDIQAKCGTLDPTKFQGSSSSGSSSTTSSTSGSSTPTSTPSSTAASTSASQAAAPTNAAYLANGAAVVAAGIFAAFL